MAIIVKREPGEDEDKLIQKFRKEVQAAQILPEMRDRKRYEKPSIVRNKKNSLLRRLRRNRRRQK